MATVEETPQKTRPAQSTSSATPITAHEPWYKDAIIYQIHVRAFRDSNRDGIGDFRGLTERLDYIQDLGVTAIWLQPFFPSPLKDDGYDVADYTNVNPQYGTLDDFKEFLDEAHRRELKVISELVMNHTSDQHEWFQRSRHAPIGSDWRNWYVWSDTPNKYPEVRIIFQDFEPSNWSWDPVAGQYYWHRFFSHQPDLNFDHPPVREAMLKVVDFWLGLGVDGMRLDAIPYLYEREGTNGENLPETHAFLREVRAHIDANFKDRMLLAEANQWPEDAAAYFGNGDECHMNFHFPAMPRLFMAVEREDRSPIVDILEQTPAPPPGCQWATFLRNHDELTLEMVTDEERDYMYRTFAVDAKARINLGIRRRLAPLMGNDRRKIELMNALLLSLPGTPILYYGDEIEMGDNYYLGDRNGVRTPMQWSADRNAGFSRANPQSLYLPVNIDPEYHYEMRNVEVQLANPHSLLWWTRRILNVRKQYTAFGRGTFEALSASNAKVFAFLRETENETILVVANLARVAQHVELDLSRFRGRSLIELFGYTTFPTIGDQPYTLSLGPHGFYWFCIRCGEQESGDDRPIILPTYRARSGWSELFAGGGHKAFCDSVESYLRRQRWFATRARALQRVELVDTFELETSPTEPPLRLIFLRAVYSEGEPDMYAIPVTLLDEAATEKQLETHPLTGILRISSAETGKQITLCEATWSDRLWPALFAMIANGRRRIGARGTLSGIRTAAFSDITGDESTIDLPHAVPTGSHHNTSVAFDETFMLKLFRNVSPGPNPELEIGRALTHCDPRPAIARLAGAIEYRGEADSQITIAALHEYMDHVSDAKMMTHDELARYFERVQALEAVAASSQSDGETGTANFPGVETTSLVQLTKAELPPLAEEMIGGYLHLAELLGQRVGELHVGLAKADGTIAFAPEPFSRLYQRGLYQSMRNQLRTSFDMLRSRKHRLSESAQAHADQLLKLERTLITKFSELTANGVFQAQRIRCHGDMHLAQVLYTGKDFVIIDFEGDSNRPVSERRIKTSPLRDVAGMLRSFHYAAHKATLGETSAQIVLHSSPAVAEWARFWSTWVCASFLRSYLETAGPGGFLPTDDKQLETLLTTYLLERALNELRYELVNRPNLVDVPLHGLLHICNANAASASDHAATVT
jgi:maltose alpha-D-glucosyltransferase/alpha-amylase